MLLSLIQGKAIRKGLHPDVFQILALRPESMEAIMVCIQSIIELFAPLGYIAYQNVLFFSSAR